MFRTLSVAALAAAAIAAAPAAAVTYDAFSSFTGTSTGGAFTYGTYDHGSFSFTPFNDAPGCASLISNVVCTSNGFLPAAFKSTSGAHQSGTVIVPGDALILHPGPNAGQAAAVLFTSPITGTLTIDFSAFVADTNPSGVNLVFFTPGLPYDTVMFTLTAANPTYSFNTSTLNAFTAGSSFGFAVDYDSLYNNDSTGINFSVSVVPEPATWALMITGFGLVGVGLRRRAAVAAA